MAFSYTYPSGLYRFPAYQPTEDDEPDDADDWSAPITNRHTRLMDTDARPLALRKCGRCGCYLCEDFYQHSYSHTCTLCEYEAEHPLVQTKAGRNGYSARCDGSRRAITPRRHLCNPVPDGVYFFGIGFGIPI